MCPGSDSSLGLNTEFSRLSHLLSKDLRPTANQVYFKAGLRLRAQCRNPESEGAILRRGPIWFFAELHLVHKWPHGGNPAPKHCSCQEVQPLAYAGSRQWSCALRIGQCA